MSHRADVSRLDLGAPAAIYDFQARHCASIAVGLFDYGNKGRIAKWSADHTFNKWPFEYDSFFFKRPCIRTIFRSGLPKYSGVACMKDEIVFGVRNEANGSSKCTLVRLTIVSYESRLEILFAISE